MKITILGAGAFGLALASIFKENKNSVTVWSRFEEEVILLRKNNTNEKIKNIKLPEDIKYTSDLNLAIENSEIVVIAIPAQFVDNLVKQLKPIVKKQYILIASKGIENDTFSFLEEVVRRGINTRKMAVISGPTFAVDIANKYPVGFTLASRSWMTREVIKKTLVNSHVKVRASRDVVGVEVCGSIKNVISIAAGMIEGMNYPESTKAMFITESLHDLKNLIKALGGNKKTILTFAGFGDLLMTATSTKSRNFTFGKMLGENKSKEEIEKYRKETTIEGLYTLESIYKLIKKKKVYMPIIYLIKDIVDGKKEAKCLIDLLTSDRVFK
ncbi:MAG: NAD(P)-dependent glycerol-3-phosphate dehydrogenase [Clostridiales bacterium]|nr:NAD(P)-dependent glycerol-3-phosphate dehydrogenase [Clostridiales bacterium]